jgi:hypothetical protein
VSGIDLALWHTDEGLKRSFTLGWYATAEAAAQAHDRATLLLQSAGWSVPAGLNFPEVYYAGEELPRIAGTEMFTTACMAVGLFFASLLYECSSV